MLIDKALTKSKANSGPPNISLPVCSHGLSSFTALCVCQALFFLCISWHTQDDVGRQKKKSKMCFFLSLFTVAFYESSSWAYSQVLTACVCVRVWGCVCVWGVGGSTGSPCCLGLHVCVCSICGKRLRERKREPEWRRPPVLLEQTCVFEFGTQGPLFSTILKHINKQNAIITVTWSYSFLLWFVIFSQFHDQIVQKY